jgi:hypothetical protein
MGRWERREYIREIEGERSGLEGLEMALEGNEMGGTLRRDDGRAGTVP